MDPDRYSWGEGANAVALLVGEWAVVESDEEFDLPGWERTRVRGRRAVVVPIGDEGIGQIAFLWRAGGCRYTAWVNPPWKVDEVKRYARRY